MYVIQAAVVVARDTVVRKVQRHHVGVLRDAGSSTTITTVERRRTIITLARRDENRVGAVRLPDRRSDRDVVVVGRFFRSHRAE